MARYGKKAQDKVKQAMRERKRGTLRSGGSGKRVTSRKQAIAIGLAQARRAGAKMPRKPSARKRSTRRKASRWLSRGAGARRRPRRCARRAPARA